jgi:hypothetical protein
MKTLSKLVVGGTLGLISLLPTQEAKAQLPFFAGEKVPATYAVESRTFAKPEDPEFDSRLVLKTFRDEIPLWAYLGIPYNNENGLGDAFYGVGPILNFNDRLHILPTVEGSGKEFSGVTFYNTLYLGKDKDWHVDFHPGLNENLRYNSTPFSVGKTYKGFTFGASSEVGDLGDTTLRIARVKDGNFIDVGFSPRDKELRVSLQKTF